MPKDNSKPINVAGSKRPKADKAPKEERDVKVAVDQPLEPLEPTDYASALRRQDELLAQVQQLAELQHEASLQLKEATKQTKKFKAEVNRKAREEAPREIDPDMLVGTKLFSNGYKWVDIEEDDRRVEEMNTPVTRGTRSGRSFHP
ncbi:uncharacterized protein LOC62_02G002911 [Vanrija pseudolonga]|uniref:Uncharacterized protein n=1 Tax=Vanrija pseudolonga TaxID=143232 RepID=A0AAF0Y3I8_9TREE|nr:hypothetical protein LOC62_02G002911 [Vanrija pseudolonga]